MKRAKKPQSPGDKIAGRYWSTNQFPPTWHDGFIEALDMIYYEITVNGLTAETIVQAIKEAKKQIAELGAEE